MLEEAIIILETAYRRYQAAYKATETDEEYLELMARLRENEPQFQAVMESLTQAQQDIITEHLGICGELSERAVEIACFLP